VGTVLIVGAGTAGTALAILLAEQGVDVDLVERRPETGAVGSGITLQGNALRVLRQVGVWPQVSRAGFAFDSMSLRAPDTDATVLAVVDDVRTGGPDLPATLGIYRPTLAGLLVERAQAMGAKLRSPVSPIAIEQHVDRVTVTFDDGSIGSYDLVVGADGVRSTVRDLIGAQVDTRSSGIGVWRVFTARPSSVTRTELYYGGPSNLAGYTPSGPDSLYAYLSEPAQDRTGLTGTQRLALFRELAGAYHGPWDEIRASLQDTALVHYTVPETHVLDRPWHRGRVVIIGDAAHCCPPSLAQGAAQALEDAAVLAELLLEPTEVDECLWTAFMDRRYARATMVVQASNQLNEWQLRHEQGDVAGVAARVSSILKQPA
jgi:2-polyprenyl-6-methoxyphenol hydroxylase-like FAD-dependent oxidoreductase